MHNRGRDHQVPDVNNSPRDKLLDGGQHELAAVISKLESCLETSEGLELSLLSALLDHALGEARKQLGA